MSLLLEYICLSQLWLLRIHPYICIPQRKILGSKHLINNTKFPAGKYCHIFISNAIIHFYDHIDSNFFAILIHQCFPPSVNENACINFNSLPENIRPFCSVLMPRQHNEIIGVTLCCYVLNLSFNNQICVLMHCRKHSSLYQNG